MWLKPVFNINFLKNAFLTPGFWHLMDPCGPIAPGMCSKTAGTVLKLLCIVILPFLVAFNWVIMWVKPVLNISFWQNTFLTPGFWPIMDRCGSISSEMFSKTAGIFLKFLCIVILWISKLRVASYELRVTSWPLELRVTS